VISTNIHLHDYVSRENYDEQHAKKVTTFLENNYIRENSFKIEENVDLPNSGTFLRLNGTDKYRNQAGSLKINRTSYFLFDGNGKLVDSDDYFMIEAEKEDVLKQFCSGLDDLFEQNDLTC